MKGMKMKTIILISLAIITIGCYPRGVQICNQDGCGNGFYLNSNGIVYTATHNLIAEEDTYILVPADYYLGSYDLPIKKSIDYPSQDISILRTNKINSKKYEICKNDPKIGENVIVRYYKSKTVKYKIKSSIIDVNYSSFYLLFVSDFGVSGAPVISEYGCIYGLVSRNTNSGLKIERLR